MNEQRIYPDDFAKMLMARAGQPYRPSNGTEGECFFDAWCRRCARDKAMSEGLTSTMCDDNERCDIIGRTMAFRTEEDGYPKEWRYRMDGQPCCTAFVPVGEPVPARRCELTLDMFASDAMGDEEGHRKSSVRGAYFCR